MSRKYYLHTYWEDMLRQCEKIIYISDDQQGHKAGPLCDSRC